MSPFAPREVSGSVIGQGPYFCTSSERMATMPPAGIHEPPMRWRQLLSRCLKIAVCVAAICEATLVAVIVWGAQHHVMLGPQAALKIKKGMTQQEVEYVIGGLPGYHGNYFAFNPVSFSTGPQSRSQVPCSTWIDDNDQVTVYWDRDGRAWYWTYGPARHHPPPLWDRLKSRFGF